ncbi:MAG: argininosuccinate lyase [Candidatus Omnitrophica bacterium]|nr:argininosuccinate lyase [Candidatus Omnitrophota bacterium]MBU4589863.1 argininosuccinate lyase [Candidatus Omnitrophota bacterium]
MKNKLWGGRFSKKTNPLVEEFTKSIQFDKKLAEYDCMGSLAHINVLKKAKLLSAEEHKELESGLEGILSSIRKGSFKIDDSFEDIHSYVQHLLEKKAGKVALKLHTCRSRNDQVVFDTKMYCVKNAAYTLNLFSDLGKVLDKLAKNNAGQVIAGYTHMQHAMPISLQDYLGAYSEMLKRDSNRIDNASKGISLTLGSGAIAGTFIDAEKYSSPAVNSIDTVSDRDFVIEILSALAITGMHLSRLAEDLILWSTKEFDFIDIDEAFCTGSSLMPQKKNPDALELIRGNTGKLYGNLMSVLVMMKGLPLSYNRDMQLDKEPLFESFEIIQKELKIMVALLPEIKFNKKNIARQLEDESLYATDLADYLVQNKVVFKDAHAIIGRLVKTGKEIKKMSSAELKKFHPALNSKVVNKIIDPKQSVASKKSVKRKKR